MADYGAAPATIGPQYDETENHAIPALRIPRRSRLSPVRSDWRRQRIVNSEPPLALRPARPGNRCRTSF